MPSRLFGRSLSGVVALVAILCWRASVFAAGSTWVLAGPTAGGRITSIAVDVANTSVVYAVVTAPRPSFDGPDPGAAGLYRSVDGGATWTASAADLPDGTKTNASVTAIVADLSAASAVYLGTTHGVFKSADRGITWTKTGFPAASVSSLAMYAVASSAVLYAGTSSGLYRSADRGVTSQKIGSGLPFGS